MILCVERDSLDEVTTTTITVDMVFLYVVIGISSYLTAC